MSSSLINDSALPWDGLTFIQGDPVTPSTSHHAHITVLEQWATWCPPCRSSIPHLNSLAQRYHKQGVRVVGVTNETDRGKLLKFIAGMGSSFKYAVAMDENGVMDDWQSRYKVQGIPHAYVIDHEGRVRWSGHPMAGLDGVLERLVGELKQWQAKQAGGGGAGGGGGVGKVDEAKAGRLRGMSEEELRGKGVGELMRLMKEAGIDSAGCIEKGDLISRIHGHALK